MVSTGPCQRSKTVTHCAWCRSLRSTNAMNAPVSRMSSPGTPQLPQQVVAMMLPEIGTPALDGTDQVAYPIDRP